MKAIRILTMFFGSNTMQSNTIKIQRKIEKKLKLILKNEILFKEIYVNNIKIKPCQGCKNCFKFGKCLLDDYDDMSKIKRELLYADLLIIATPIYFNNIPGIFKLFLDRISYWSHIMKLNGCPCIVILTSGNNGVNSTGEYLFDTLSFLGLNIIGYIQSSNNDIMKNEKEEILINTIIDRWRILYNNVLNTNSVLEKIFSRYKFLYSIDRSNSYEKIYWLDAKKWNTYYLLINDVKYKK